MGFQLNEISCLRELDHDQIDKSIKRRQQWREITEQRQSSFVKNNLPDIAKRWRPISDETIANLHELAEVLLSSAVEFKLVVSVEQGYVYSNDTALLDQLGRVNALRGKTYTQAKVERPKNTIQLKNPQHEFRSFFKITKLTVIQKKCLTDFLQNQKKHVRISPALQRWIDQPFNRTQDYFFIDHTGASWVSMLSLVAPGIIRKTMQIITAK